MGDITVDIDAKPIYHYLTHGVAEACKSKKEDYD